MSTTDDKLIDMIENESVSAIQIMSRRLDLSEDSVREMLNQLVESGRIEGELTEDGKRFFKREVKLSDSPVVGEKDEGPDFLEFNPIPGRITALIGLTVVIISLAGYYTVDPFNFQLQSAFALLLLIGIVILLSGCYYLGQRKTP
jgi:hypothetical protein